MTRQTTVEAPLQYWLVKSTKEILIISGSHKPTDIWRHNYMRLRFFHHPESDAVMYEDWNLLVNDLECRPSVLNSGVVDEISYEDYLWLKTLYDNPDL